MSKIEDLIRPILQSPLLPEVASRLALQVERECVMRDRFYDEMTPDQKVEFIDGEVVLHSPARNKHLVVTKYILVLVDLYVRKHTLGIVLSEKCLCVFPRNDYEPDVVFFGIDKSSQLKADTLKFPIPDLIVEVLSETTESRDRGTKLQDFAANGVMEYWIVDAEAECVEQYLLAGDQYDLNMKSSTGVLKCQAIAGFQTDIDSFFDGTKNLLASRKILTDLK